MRRLGEDDLKHLANLIKAVQKAKFTELTGAEVLGVSNSIKWAFGFAAELHDDLNPKISAPKSPIVSPPIKEAPKGKKK